MILGVLACALFDSRENPAPTPEEFCALATSFDTAAPSGGVQIRCGWSNIEECGSDEFITNVSEAAFEHASEQCSKAGGVVQEEEDWCTNDTGARVSSFFYYCGIGAYE